MDVPARSSLTAEDFYRLPDDDILYELVRGRLISEPRPGARHGRIATRITSLLDGYARKMNYGFVLTCDCGFILARDPDSVRGPDVAFVTRDRYLAVEDETRFFPGPPDLAVEVLSPSDRTAKVQAKVADYLNAGTSLVWVVDPSAREVHVHGIGSAPSVLAGTDVLTATDLLPSFCLPVGDIFTL